MRSRFSFAAVLSAATFLLVVSLSNCGDGITPPPPPPPTEVITFNSIAPSNGEVLVQKNCVSASDCDRTIIQVSAGAVSNITGTVSLSFWLNGNSVGSMSPGSITVGFGSHSLRIVASGKGSTRDTTVTFAVVAAPPIVVECIPHSIGGILLDCSQLRAWAIKGNVRDSADAVNNRMEIHPRLRLLPDTGRVQIVVDFRDTTRRTHYGMDPFVSKDSLSFVQKVILVPMNYAIPRGRWAMQVVPINLIIAFQRPVNLDGSLGLPYFSAAVDSLGWPGFRTYNLQVTIPFAEMPVPVVINRDGSNFAIDSARKISFLEELENEIGWDFGTPSSLEQAIDSEKYYIDLVADSTIGHDRNDYGPKSCTIWFSFGWGDASDSERFVTKHSMIHCFGAGHISNPPYGPTGWWPSLMSVVQGGDSLYGVAVKEEVAHLRLWYEIDALEKQVSGKGWPTGLCSLANAHQWQRVRAGLPREFPRSC